MINSDSISRAGDKFDRARFAEGIAKSIASYAAHNTDSLVIGINGAWGSGKSTLLAKIKDVLIESTDYASKSKTQGAFHKFLKKIKRNKAQQHKTYILDFNPWMFSGKEELHSNFLIEFGSMIGSVNQRTRKTIQNLSRRMQWFSKLHPVADAISEGISSASKASVEKLKNEVSDLLVNQDIKVIVTIDDIDRLAPHEILEMFQLVKLNANFKNTIFILVFDKPVVIETIENHYLFDGEKYLEKIIQVDYTIPAFLPEQLESEFFSRMQQLEEQYEIGINQNILTSLWLFHGLKNYFRNIRDLNRYFNALAFRLPSIMRNVNIYDFLVIESIRLFDYSAFELIRDNHRISKEFGNPSAYDEQRKHLFIDNTERLYAYMFDESIPKHLPGEADHRISLLQNFERYFTLSISNRDVSEEIFREYIFNPTRRFQIFESAIQDRKLPSLLRRIITYPESTDPVDLTMSVKVMFDIWRHRPNEFAAVWRDFCQAIIAIVRTSKEIKPALASLIDTAIKWQQEFNPAQFIFHWVLMENIRKFDPKNIDYFLVAYSDVLLAKQKEIEETWHKLLEEISTLVLFDNTLSQIYLNIFLPSYAREHSESFTKKADSLISNQKIFFKVIDIFVYRDSRTRTPFGINELRMSEILTGEFEFKFWNAVKLTNTAILSSSDAETIEGLRAYERSRKDPFKGRRISKLNSSDN